MSKRLRELPAFAVFTIFFICIFSHSIFAQSFSAPKLFDAGYGSHMLVAEDFNNDGLVDIATANYSGDNISVLIALKTDSFASEVLYSAGNGTYDIATGHFNNDNALDIVVSNYIDDNISVFLNNGNGTFATRVNYSADNGSRGIVTGFFNNDTIVDIVVANDLADNISLFTGIGNGTFNTKSNFVAGDRPHGLLIDFINADAFPDLITMNRNDHDISVILGNGNGTFQTPVKFDVSKYPQFGTLGYFNNDSLLDLAVCNTFNYDSVSILLGNSSTIFGPAQNFYAGDEPYAVAAADYNLDTKIDLAVTNYTTDSISILIGNGDGTFQAPNRILTGDNPNGIIAIDIDQDSDIDLINVNYQGGGSTSLLLNNTCPIINFTKTDVSLIGGNNGTAMAIVSSGLRPFTYSWNDPLNQTDSIAIGLSSGIYSVTVTDSLGCVVQADVQINEPICNLQLTTSSIHVSAIGGSDGTSKVSVTNGTPPYTFLWNDSSAQSDSIAIGLAQGNYQVIVSDSIGCIDTAEVTILEMPCLNEDRYYSSFGATDIEICHINNDSILDIVTLNSVTYGTDRINILLGNGDGSTTYHSSFTIGTGGDQPVNIVVNDFNGDNFNDIIVAIPDGVNGISVYFGNGDGTFQSKVNYFVGSRPWDIVSHDVDFDGDQDLLICREQGDDVRILKNNGSGVFSSFASKSVGWNPQVIKAGYLNNDSLIDLVVVNKLQANISVLLGSSSYTHFSSNVNYLVGLQPIDATLNDFNNDGITDIVVTASSQNKIHVFIGNGDGTFQPNVAYDSGAGTSRINSLDLNNDTNMDLVVANGSGNALQIFLGEGNGVIENVLSYSLNAVPTRMAVADLDKDGDTEIVLTLSGKDSIVVLDNCFFEKCMFLSVDSIKAASFGEEDGFASISVLGNNPPFSYQWSDSRMQLTLAADSLLAGTYKVVVSDSLGCKDSVFVTIDELPCMQELDSTSFSICEGDSVLFFGNYYSQSGIYSDTSTNSIGCDSISQLYLTVKSNTFSTHVLAACSIYTVPSGDETYTVSGIYQDTIPNNSGCDSLITINLTINQSSTSNITETVCGSYTVPSGDETYTASGVYQDTIPNNSGCDSLITINLTVNQNSTSAFTQTTCGSYTVPSGDETYTVTGVYQDTIPNNSGCDSLMTINLTVNQNSTSTFTETTCGSYTVPSGDETYTVSGVYQDTIPNNKGCDSLMTINLTVASIDVSVFQQQDSLFAIATSASYQWLDCQNGFAIIPGAVNQYYKPSSNGSFAVEITQNNCIDTSTCYIVDNIGIVEGDFGKQFKVFPNPTSGRISVDLGEPFELIQLEILDGSGKHLRHKTLLNVSSFEENIYEASGVYFVKIRAKNKLAIIRVVKE